MKKGSWFPAMAERRSRAGKSKTNPGDNLFRFNIPPPDYSQALGVFVSKMAKFEANWLDSSHL